MNVRSGQTVTIAEAQVLFDATARTFDWYIQDNASPPNNSDPNSATASSLAADGWAVSYDIPTATFTVTVSSNPAYQGRSFHAGCRDGAAPSNNYWISSDFTVAVPQAPVPVPTLTATPQIVNGVPSIILQGF